jgi:hypothetical protein
MPLLQKHLGAVHPTSFRLRLQSTGLTWPRFGGIRSLDSQSKSLPLADTIS